MSGVNGAQTCPTCGKSFVIAANQTLVVPCDDTRLAHQVAEQFRSKQPNFEVAIVCGRAMRGASESELRDLVALIRGHVSPDMALDALRKLALVVMKERSGESNDE